MAAKKSQVKSTHGGKAPQVKATHAKGKGAGLAPKVKLAAHQKNLTAESWARANEWVQVISTNVARIRYNHLQKVMWVEFKDRSVYRCPGFPKDLAVDYYNTPSMGKYHWKLRKMGRKFKKV